MQRIAPLNRPTVTTLAGVESQRRVIPAERVAEMERIAAAAVAPSQRIEQAESRCRDGIGRIAHAGWQRGFARGHAEALAQLKAFQSALEERRRAVDAELIAMVSEAVTRIVRRMPAELLTESLIVAALDEAQGERGRAVLRVHPERVPMAERFLSGRADATTAALCIVVEADGTLNPDDCTLETSSGVIEAGLSVQLEALQAMLFSAARRLRASDSQQEEPEPSIAGRLGAETE